MLKTIRSSLVKRRRVVEEDVIQASSGPNVTRQVDGPQLNEPPSPPVWGRVKWYNPDKLYGFVVLSDGSGDAFLHASALAGIGFSALQPGETLALRVSPGERGLLVTEVISVDSSTAAPSRPSRTRIRSPSDRAWKRASKRWGR
jgi:cold shock CspA family protein